MIVIGGDTHKGSHALWPQALLASARSLWVPRARRTNWFGLVAVGLDLGG